MHVKTCLCRCRNTSFLKLLLDAGSKLGKSIDANEYGGWTAAMRACEYDNYDALQMIITYKPNLDAQQDSTGMTALMVCVLHGRLRCARLLMENGAQVDTTNHTYEGYTGAHELKLTNATALIFAVLRGHDEIVSLLVEHKANVNVTEAGHSQRTPLMCACQFGHVECARILLNVDSINIRTTDAFGHTAMMIAAGNGHARIVRSAPELFDNSYKLTPGF